MTNAKPNPIIPHFGIAAVAAVALVTLTVAGCFKNYGRFNIDTHVSQAFRTGSIQSEYQYYYAGRQTIPYAIIAIDRSYSVPSKYWVPFEPQSEQLKNMSAGIFSAYRYPSYGAQILDPDGVVIGIWYGNARSNSVRVDQANRTVSVLFNNPESGDGPGAKGYRL